MSLRFYQAGGAGKTMAQGDVAVNNPGAFTIATIVKRNENSTTDTLFNDSSGTTLRLDALVASDGKLTVRKRNPLVSRNTTSTFLVVADGWCFLAVTKTAGTNTPRAHRYKYSDGSWLHENFDGTLANAAAGNAIHLGFDGTTSYMRGDQQIVGFFSRDTSDAELEASGLQWNFAAWRRLAGLTGSNAGVWPMWNELPGTPLVDYTGGGANETADEGAFLGDTCPWFKKGGGPILILRPQAVDGDQTIAVGVATETETADPVGIGLSVGVASESEAAQVIGMGLAVGLASETETADIVGIGLSVQTASETETALAVPVIQDQFILVGVASETEVANPVTTVIQVVVGVASETEVAQIVGIGLSVGVASETEIANPVITVIQVIVGAASETETADIVGIGLGIGTASETEAAQIVGIGLGVLAASETETALVVTPVLAGGPQTIPVGVASETETALVITPVQGLTITVGVASETETANPVGIGLGIGVASETETAQIVGIGLSIGLASETEVANAVPPVPTISITVGTAPETEAADIVGIGLSVGVATETEVAGSVPPAPTITITVATASEVETAQIVGIGLGVLTATETETALGVIPSTGAQLVVVGLASEIEVAGSVTTGTIRADPFPRSLRDSEREPVKREREYGWIKE